MKPMLMRSGLTDRIFIVTRYRDRGEGRYLAQTKYEVSEEELEACGLVRVEEPATPTPTPPKDDSA